MNLINIFVGLIPFAQKNANLFDIWFYKLMKRARKYRFLFALFHIEMLVDNMKFFREFSVDYLIDNVIILFGDHKLSRIFSFG